MEVRRALLPTGGRQDSAALSPPKLFFDLVLLFFARTQVTTTMAAKERGADVGRPAPGVPRDLRRCRAAL